MRRWEWKDTHQSMIFKESFPHTLIRSAGVLDMRNILIRGGRRKKGQLVNYDYIPLMGKTNHAEQGGGYSMHGMGPNPSE